MLDLVSEFLMATQWSAVLQIILIDILLGGDNAVIIALACRNLPQHQRSRAIWWGTGVAILLRVAFVSVAVLLLDVPLLKLAGGLMLLWIGIKLMTDNDEGDPDIQSAGKLLAAIKTIVVADAVMSLDNVIGVAAAAEAANGVQRYALIVFGLLVSIPIIVWGSHLVLKIFDRFPSVVTLGAALLGWIAAGLILSDAFVARWVPALPWLPYVASALGALLVVGAGYLINARGKALAQAAD